MTERGSALPVVAASCILPWLCCSCNHCWHWSKIACSYGLVAWVTCTPRARRWHHKHFCCWKSTFIFISPPQMPNVWLTSTWTMIVTWMQPTFLSALSTTCLRLLRAGVVRSLGWLLYRYLYTQRFRVTMFHIVRITTIGAHVWIK